MRNKIMASLRKTKKIRQITLDYMRLKSTPKMINSGFDGQLLKKTKDNKCNDIIIDSNTNFKTFMRLFKCYDIKFYKY